MSNRSHTYQHLFKDGTSQQDRVVEALDPTYVEVEGRSIEELIQEAQQLARQLKFFNENNEAVGDWELFLVGDPAEYMDSGAVDKKRQREEWAKKLANYVEDPNQFVGDPKTINRLSSPHTVLFITFLKLLNHLKEQVNGLTKRHLDFYFLERLKMQPKEASPDAVNLLLQLAENIEEVQIEKGTVFLGGTDEEGNDLHYKADADTLISKARIKTIKNVFVDKKLLTLEVVYRQEGLEAMLKMALGTPNPGDNLPTFPDGIESLTELENKIDQQDEQAIAYLSEQLFLSSADFKQLMQSDREVQAGGDKVDMSAVYASLTQANRDRTIKKRQAFLKNIKETVGFQELIKHIYGSPNPGDNIPVYRGEEANFETINSDLDAENPELRSQAESYIVDELLLTTSDFRLVNQVQNNPSIEVADEQKAFRALELAERQIRGVILADPTSEEISDVYASADATSATFSEYGSEEESKRFKTFGNPKLNAASLPLPATIGFAISSPILLLKEGTREITVIIDVESHTVNAQNLSDVFNKSISPAFEVFLSNAEDWTKAHNPSFQFGDHVGTISEGQYVGNISKQTITITEGQPFNAFDKGKYLVLPEGEICQILNVNSEEEVTINKVGLLEAGRPSQITKYAHGQVFLSSLKVVVNLTETDAPVEPNLSPTDTPFVQSSLSTIAFSLHHQVTEGKLFSSSHYQELINLQFQRAHVSVEVSGLQSIAMQNDQNTIDARKPFEPFGSEPTVGNSCYFTNEEIASKQLNSLEIDLAWMKAPESIANHYKNYWIIENNDPKFDPGLTDASWTVKGYFHDQNTAIPIESGVEEKDFKLFPEEGKLRISDLPASIEKDTSGYRYHQTTLQSVSEDEPIAWERYFSLELDAHDFQHELYPTLFAKQALSNNEQVKALAINPPYNPKLKGIKIGYTATTEIEIGSTSNSPENKLYQIHPFGYKGVDVSGASPKLLPTYDDQGTLYLGIEELTTPQHLSMLFQLAEGSADPDLERPEIKWSYLKDNEWVELEKAAILKDTTNGLINTGIVKLNIPEEATTESTLLPGELHWVKAVAPENINAISDTVAIAAQAISATLSNEVVAPSHFKRPLPANSISEALKTIPEVADISQPYTSNKGKPKEEDRALYRRVSERIRHKSRAITSWDYEHMVLEKFPEVYKVKCIPSTTEVGRVDVIVIPDIQGKLPFNPFQPKVAADTLVQIQEYLDTYAPAFANVVVQNPFYLQVLTRCVVKFHQGVDERFHEKKLVEGIKQFLSPWAYDTSSDITIGGKLHASTLINFIAEQPYVDYVANLKLFQSDDGKAFEDVRLTNDGKDMVTPYRPDMIMVSAQTHFIDIMGESGYDEDSFEGIGYMQVFLDFIVE